MNANFLISALSERPLSEYRHIIPLVTAIIGATGVTAAVYIRHRLKIQTQRNKLRHALDAEIGNTAFLEKSSLSQLKKGISERGISHTHIPTTTFESLVGDIGLLEPEEIRPIIRYYKAAEIAQKQLESLSEENEDEAQQASLTERTLPSLIDNREKARENIGEYIERPEDER